MLSAKTFTQRVKRYHRLHVIFIHVMNEEVQTAEIQNKRICFLLELLEKVFGQNRSYDFQVYSTSLCVSAVQQDMRSWLMDSSSLLLPLANGVDSDQTVRTHSLIWVFVVRISHKMGLNWVMHNYFVVGIMHSL